VLSLRHHRRAIVICTHNLPEAEALADRIAIIRRGKIIALGTPTELKARLLGPPTMELRLTDPADGVVDMVAEFGEIEAQGETWVRYYSPNPQETNPRLLQALAARGVAVVTLSEVTRSLEDVYLQVVEEA
jgi:ABC-2 type transport system ATP-binding protein